MIQRIVPFLFALVFTAGSLFGQAPKPKPKALAKPTSILDLQDGDTFVFLGDSITHQCLYTQYIEDFFYTRYPERRIKFHNAGVSGDKAGDALARFEEDVASFKPKYVSVLLGMNDGRYEDFSSETFAIYQRDMRAIGEQIVGLRSTAIGLSPTFFDHHQLANELENNPNYRFKSREFSEQYNALMAFYGAWLRGESGESGIPYINFYGPLNDMTEKQRRTQPDFTLVPDAIHPEAAGQFIMAYEFLWQLTPDRRGVSSIGISKGKKGWVAGKAGGEVTDLIVSDEADSVTFKFLAPALPWVVPEVESGNEKLKWPSPLGARAGYRLTAAGHRMSNERLKIVGLKPGSYELKIDDVVVGNYSHAQLGSKVELQSNEATPQYQQALKVAKLNRERNDKAVRPLRDTWGKVKGIRRKLDAAGESNKFEAEFTKVKPRIDELKALAASFEDQIYEAACPILRKYEVVHVDSNK